MISVITPVYNGERYIEICIKNVIEQNCSDMEHIIVDGGSSDRTVDTIKQYAEQYPHIRWISEKDKGQSDAMNKGIAMALAKVITFLNVDDFYEPNALSYVSEIFKELPEPSLLVGNCKVLGERDELKYINCPSKLGVTNLLSFTSPFPLNPSAYFYHKSLHQRIGLYEIGEHYMMDIDFILKSVKNANVEYVDKILGNHRQIQGTKTVSLMEDGQHRSHFNDLIKKHYKTLPLSQQIEVSIRRKIDKESKRMRYFLRNPQDLLPSLMSKLVKISRSKS